MIMTPTLWETSAAAIQLIAEAPAWLKSQARLKYEEVIRLPSVEMAIDGADAIPSIEERLIKADYLDFLREQIRLEPRGPEWGRILKKRLADLSPFVGRKLIRVMLHCRPNSAVLEIDPETLAIIHVEFY
jgi:hypothetical protein